MSGIRARFTIRGLMIAVAAVAILMSLTVGWVLFVGVLGLVFAALAGAEWVEHRGHRRAAAIGFWVSALLVNGLYASACTAPDDVLSALLLVVWLFIFAPTIGRIGMAWARLATEETAVPRRSPGMAWTAVIGLTLMPCLAVSTYWPLHLAFAVARPALDRLADQAAAGQSGA